MPCLYSCVSLLNPSGPPGTGKTSLCKGLAQKLSIRLSGRWDTFIKSKRQLLSVPCHHYLCFHPKQVCTQPVCGDQQPQSLLQVVFRGTAGSVCSETLSQMRVWKLINIWLLLQSGKLVTKMFQKIQELIEDKDALVFVLIDEVLCFYIISVHSCLLFCCIWPTLA